MCAVRPRSAKRVVVAFGFRLLRPQQRDGGGRTCGQDSQVNKQSVVFCEEPLCSVLQNLPSSLAAESCPSLSVPKPLDALMRHGPLESHPYKSLLHVSDFIPQTVHTFLPFVRCAAQTFEWKLGESPIVDQYTYLGVEISKDCSRMHIQRK